MAENNSDVGITPLADRVLVRELTEEDEERTTDSGIIIPESVDEDSGQTTRGDVVAVGEGKREDGEIIPVPVSVGDRVLFSWGDKLTIDGEDFHIVDSTNILAVVEG